MTEINPDDLIARLRPAVTQVMDIADVTTGRNEKYAVRFRGQLRIDSMEAYDRVEADFRPHDVTPLFRREADQHVILAMPGLLNPRPSDARINLILFLITVFSVFYTGAAYELAPTATNPWQWLLDSLLRIYLGWPFAVGLLAILLCHEFGHYLMARRHGAPVTLPYFIPLPVPGSLGTMGAVIALKAPVRNRRVLLDIGVAGPLAGFVVALPVLILGLLRSPITTIDIPPGGGFQLEGNSIVYLAIKYLIFGQLLPAPAQYGVGGPLLHWIRYYFTSTPLPIGGKDVLLNQLAWAGWAGLLVTGLNLIPAGQLDGGHALFVLVGERVKAFVPVILAVLIGLGFFWMGWWLWAALIYYLNRRPAMLLDEITPLDAPRKVFAIAALVLFFLVITPVPLVQVTG